MKKALYFIYIFVLNFCLFGQDEILISASELYDVMPEVANCNEGKLKESEKLKALQYVNYIRSFHNLKEVYYASQYDKETAKASLISVANSLLDHFPKSSYQCYTQEGYTGCSTSNLYLGANYNPSSVFPTEKGIISWIIDKNIEDLGHRRNLLNPFLKYTSFGRVDGYSIANPNYFLTGMAIKVHQLSEYQNLLDWSSEFVAYPYNDYPSSYFDASWYLSFTLVVDKQNIWNNDNKKIDYSQATVKVVDPNNNQLTISSLKYDYLGYGVPNCIYWKVSGLQKDVKYTVTISNVKVNGTPRDYTYWFRVTDNPPTAGLQPPNLLSPPDNATDIQIPVTLSWSNVSGAQFYALQVSTNSTFDNLLVDVKNITKNSFTLTNLNDNTTYYWRVSAIKDGKTSNWSIPFSFKTKAFQLLAPLVHSPTDGETSVALNPTFIWSHVDGAEKYHLQACLDDTFDDFALLINNNEIADTFYISPTKFFPKTLYYWRVRSIKGNSFSNWSQIKTFWTLDPSSVPEYSFADSYTVLIDNILKSVIYVLGPVETAILSNIYGDRIYLDNSRFLPNAIFIPYDELSTGIWLLELKTNKTILKFKLLILK